MPLIPVRNLKRFIYKTKRDPLYAAKVFSRRVMANFYYRFGKGKSFAPEAVTLFLTHRCNLRCKMCGQWGEGGVTKKEDAGFIRQELSFEEISKLVDELAKFRPSITLFGGEPFLYPQATSIIRKVKQNKMHCLVITNGSMLEPIAEELVKSGLDELNISLDGPESLHDEIRGMPGLFGRIKKGVDKLNEYKKKYSSARPFVNLQCTVTKYNYLQLEQMLEVAAELKANSLTFHNLIFLDESLLDEQKKYDEQLNSSSEAWKGFVFPPEIDPEKLYNIMSGILKKKLLFNVDFYPNFHKQALIDYYTNPRYLPSDYAPCCLSPWIVAYVFPDGNVRPCLNFSYSFGNIKEKSFASAWNSPEAVKFRKLMKKEKIFPVCIRCTELYRY